MKVVAVANQKGGVGKTTITRELSACCALRGYTTLSIDCDPQASLTKTWLEVVDPNWPKLSNVLMSVGDASTLLELDDAVITLETHNLDLIPSDIKLARFEQEDHLATHRLKQQIEKHCQGYDLVFIDCPPQLGNLLVTALHASAYVLIPCEADLVGLEGLADLDVTIRRVLNLSNPNITKLGAIMNMYKTTRSLSHSSRLSVEQAEKLVGSVFDTNVHDYAKIAEAPSRKQPVVEYAPTHRAAEIFWNLTDEFLDRIKLSRNKIAMVK
jgi:chromosome partitioning protein